MAGQNKFSGENECKSLGPTSVNTERFCFLEAGDHLLPSAPGRDVSLNLWVSFRARAHQGFSLNILFLTPLLWNYFSG